jgi:hypothetical protein
MDNGFHERYRRRLGEELRISVKLLLGLLTEGDNCIDDNSPQLERFCLVVEKAFLHGLQGYFRSFPLFRGVGVGTADSNSLPFLRSNPQPFWHRHNMGQDEALLGLHSKHCQVRALLFFSFNSP